MDIKNAINTLKTHNKFRRGKFEEQPNSPKEVSESIDKIIAYFEKSESFQKLTDVNIQLEMDRNWFKNKSEKLDSELAIYREENRLIKNDYHRINNARIFDKSFTIIGVVSLVFIVVLACYQIIK
tara:strand:+ start:192 stop:566 length:375 start_codon:yes stop_codon:yes gene_type:complete